jgi:hypothetical protein
VWAIYGDPALAKRHQDPFPLHERCFNQSETITGAEWQPRDKPRDGADPRNPTHEDLHELVEFEVTRYVRVDPPADEEATDG